MSQLPLPGADPNADQQALAAARAAREYDRPIKRFLISLGRGAWGYPTYRTFYTPESDAKLNLAIAQLNAFIKKEIDDDLEGNDFDAGVNQRVLQRWKIALIDLEADEGQAIGINAVRSIFLEMVRQGEVRIDGRGVCILLDEKAAQRLIDGNVDEDLSVSEGGTYVTVIDGQWVAGKGDPEYFGWMKVNANALMRLYDVLGTMSLYENWSILEIKDEDGAFVYEG